MVVLPPLIESQMDAAEARRFLVVAAEIESKALGVEALVLVWLLAELEEILRRPRDVLPKDPWDEACDVVSEQEDETEN